MELLDFIEIRFSLLYLGSTIVVYATYIDRYVTPIRSGNPNGRRLRSEIGSNCDLEESYRT